MAKKGDSGDIYRSGFTPLMAPQPFPPPSATVQVELGAHSRRGKSREVNEDHYLVIRLSRRQETLMSSLPAGAIAPEFDESGYAMVVADGMGDTGAGETASRLAIMTLVQLVRHFGRWNLRIDDAIAQEMMDRAERFYRHVDTTVAHEGAESAVGGLRTTLTAVFGAGVDLFFAHVGHSRAYLFRQGRMLRLTRDHTVGFKRAPAAPIAPLVDVSAGARDLKHILTGAIGMSGSIGPKIDLERIRLLDNDTVLVCTNGLTDTLEEPVIAKILESGQSPDAQCRQLVDLAMESESADDVTALVGRYHIPHGDGM